ncbi:hypothetical protein J1792_15035 [Streptomyces triculaminicus]|uniref:Uncharacterized protein n=1 Tax=Streptomyces triculaminicus TaxID=2816232 RepID=A0A939FQB4_9ACTN|nr:hypothetical protein [Streptomyces triculaminicus]MBO0654040.1 hypothetical protein [Streptomyces triculaminicus]
MSSCQSCSAGRSVPPELFIRTLITRLRCVALHWLTGLCASVITRQILAFHTLHLHQVWAHRAVSRAAHIAAAQRCRADGVFARLLTLEGPCA